MVMTREVNTMLSLQHPNILMLFGFYLIMAQSDLILQCSMIMELMDCELEKYIEERRGIERQDGGRGLSNGEGIYIMAEIARGMNHLHKCRCSHRDLKPGNVLLKRSDIPKFHVEVKIADFGTSGLMVDSNSDRTAGTTKYKTPEQFDPEAMLKPDKIDVFSFGVLCSKILMGEEPYGGLGGNELIRHIFSGNKPETPDRGLPDDVVGVIKQCLNSKQEARPNFDKICGILDIALKKVWSTLSSNSGASQPNLHNKCEILESFGANFHWHVVPFASTSSHPREMTPKQKQNFRRSLDGFGLPEDYIYYVIPSHDVKILRRIGGKWAVVYEVEWAGTRHALKQFDADWEPWYFPTWKMFPKQNHVNIVTFFCYYLLSDNRSRRPGIMMELFKTNLRHFLHEEGKLLERRNWPLLMSEEESRHIMKEIAKGMAYLHGMGILHGDLKPSNVLIRREGNDLVVKHIDFSGEKCRNMDAAELPS